MQKAAQREAQQRELDLYSLSWPIFVELALTTLISTIGLWMVGQISAAAVAVFGLSGQLRLVFDRVFRVVSMGTSVVVTQHRGGNDVEGAKALALAGVSASVWLGAVCALLVGAYPDWLLRALHTPAELMPSAVPFLRVVALAMAVEAVNLTMFAVLRAFTYTQVSMRLVMAMNFLHIIVSAPLVFGWFGLPQLGVMGLAWGQLASRLLVMGLLVWVWSFKLGVVVRLRHAFSVAREPLRAILHIGLPSAGEKIGFRVCFIITVAMTGSLGTVALAVHAYAMQINGIVNLVVNSVSAGAELMIGHHVGAGRLRDANTLLWRALRICLISTSVGGLLAWLIAPHAIALFSDNPAVPALLGVILAIELGAGIGRCFNILVTGALRATGDARYPAKVNIYINVVVGVGLCWLLGIHLGFGLAGIWWGYLGDECLRGLSVGIRWAQCRWTPMARAARRRVLNRKRQSLQTA